MLKSREFDPQEEVADTMGLPMKHPMKNTKYEKMGYDYRIGSGQKIGLGSNLTFQERLRAYQNLIQTNKLTCNCKKSKCIRGYCECFSNGAFCGKNCRCQNCQNHANPNDSKASLESQLQQKHRLNLQRNFHQKRNKVIICNCSKSHCQKNYCPCFKAKQPCGIYCKCINCHHQ